MRDEATLRTDVNIIQCSNLAALTFLVYDILLVLHLEVEFVWKHRWSGGKLLYTWNRFFGLSTVVINTIAYFEPSLQKIDLALPWWQGISIIVAILTTEFVLQLRIFAVYEGNKKLLSIMAVFFLATTVMTLSLFIKYMNESGTTLYPYLWIPSLVFETFLCLLMVFKATTLYNRELRSPLLIVLIRDSIVYFVIALTTMLANCIGGYLRPGASTFGLNWVLVVPCALGSRLLLNMRREYFGRERFDESSGGTGYELGRWHAAPMRSGVLSSVIMSG